MADAGAGESSGFGLGFEWPRSSITKDVRLLEQTGCVVSERRPNSGHGVYKVVRAIGPE